MNFHYQGRACIYYTFRIFISLIALNYWQKIQGVMQLIEKHIILQDDVYKLYKYDIYKHYLSQHH